MSQIPHTTPASSTGPGPVDDAARVVGPVAASDVLLSTPVGHAGPMARAGDAVDPRVERSRATILEATLEVLAEGGYGPLTIEAVAARAGVGKSTIYRHWPGKLQLVEDAFVTLKAQQQPPPPGPVDQRVAQVLEPFASGLCSPSIPAACLPALIEAAEQCPEMAQVTAQIARNGSRTLVAVLEDAVESGELRPGTDIELLADTLTGPFILRRLLHQDPIPVTQVPTIVAQILPLATPAEPEPA